MVRPAHVPRPHTQLGLQPRVHQPTVRRTARRPQQDEQDRSHAPRPTHPAARPAAAPDLQHPTRRRRQRPPRGQWWCRTGDHTSYALAVERVMRCSTTTFDRLGRSKGVATHGNPQDRPGAWSVSNGDQSLTREMRCGTTGYTPRNVKGEGGIQSRRKSRLFFSKRLHHNDFRPLATFAGNARSTVAQQHSRSNPIAAQRISSTNADVYQRLSRTCIALRINGFRALQHKGFRDG